MRRLLVLIFTIFLFASIGSSEPPSFSGHVKYQGSYLDFDSRDLIQDALDARLNSRSQWGDWEGVIEGQGLLYSIDGDNPSLLSKKRGRELLPDDRTRLFDLTAITDGDGDTVSALRIDRAFLSRSSPEAVLKIGRQAISFGNGIVFNVLDLFNPFPPTAIDKEYKTGDDLVYAQLLLSTNTDLQLVVVPRRDAASRDLEGDESSWGGKLHSRFDELKVDIDLVAARHYGETVLGMGLSRDLLEAVARADASIVLLEDGGSAVSAIGNIDRGFTVLEKNLYLFAEFFHSAFGSTDKEYLAGSPRRETRINRGELYVAGKNYGATGVRLEATPRMNVYGSTIVNLADRSMIFQSRIAQELSQSINLIVGVNLPLGRTGSEFGGITDAGGAPLTELPIEGFLRLEWYF